MKAEELKVGYFTYSYYNDPNRQHIILYKITKIIEKKIHTHKIDMLKEEIVVVDFIESFEYYNNSKLWTEDRKWNKIPDTIRKKSFKMIFSTKKIKWSYQ